MGLGRPTFDRHSRRRTALGAACSLLLLLLVSAQLLAVASGQATTFAQLSDAIATKKTYFEVSGTVTLTANLPEITHSMTVVGKNNAKIDGDWWKYRLFVVNGGSLTLKDVQLYKGQAPLKSSRPAKKFPPLADGGAVLLYAGASAEFHNVFFNHSKSWNGAAVAAYGASTIKVVKCRFLNNYAWYAGGGIYLAEKSKGWASETSFERNKGPDEGGAVLVKDGSYYKSVGCTYKRNTCKEEGGGAWIVEGDGSVVVSVSDTFFENRCELKSARGGAILVADKGTLFLSKSTFVGNKVPSGIGNTIWVDEGVIGLLDGPPTSVVESPKDKPAPAIPTDPTKVTLP